VCLEDNKCNEQDDPQTYPAYLKWMEKHRTNYVQSPVAVEICAKHHMCSQKLYDSVRKQAIEKRGLDTYPIACPVLGCAEKLMQTPKERKVWDFMVEVCLNGHLIDYNCYLRMKSVQTQVCPLCRNEFRIDYAHCIPTLPLTSPHGLSECAKLDGMGVFLDLSLAEEEARGTGISMDPLNEDESILWLVPRKYVSYENFPSMIQEIFMDPRHDSTVPEVHTKVPLVLILAQEINHYEMLEDLVTFFLKEWASLQGVIDVLKPCGLDAFVQIKDNLGEILFLIGRVFPPKNKLHENVVEKLELVLNIFKAADLFVQEEWWSILTAQHDTHKKICLMNEVVPEVPALPDVANPSGPIAREPLPQD